MRREHFFILEIGPETIGGICVAVDGEKKVFVTKAFPSAAWGERIVWRGRWGFPRVSPIVALDASIAHTAVIPVSHVREHIRDPLRAQELEDILSQSVARALTQARKDAARELGADELDVLLAKAQVSNFRIDGHQVLNPLGFRAQKVDAAVRLTFTARRVCAEAKRIVGETTPFFFVDIADAELLCLERVGEQPVHLISVRPWQSSRFSMQYRAATGYAVHRGNLVWRARGFEEAIREAWGVGPAVARRLYGMRLRGELGEAVARFFDRMFLPRARSFFAEIAAMKLKGRVYIDAAQELPFGIAVRKRAMSLEEPPVAALLERLGFAFDAAAAGFPPRSAFRFLSIFFAYYYDKSDARMNAWLTKRLGWLDGRGTGQAG